MQIIKKINKYNQLTDAEFSISVFFHSLLLITAGSITAAARTVYFFFFSFFEILLLFLYNKFMTFVAYNLLAALTLFSYVIIIKLNYKLYLLSLVVLQFSLLNSVSF